MAFFKRKDSFDALVESDIKEITSSKLTAGAGDSSYVKYDEGTRPLPKKPRALAGAFLILNILAILHGAIVMAEFIWRYIRRNQSGVPLPLSALLFHIIFFVLKGILCIMGSISGIVVEAIFTLGVSILFVVFCVADAFAAGTAIGTYFNISWCQSVFNFFGFATPVDPLQWLIIDLMLTTVAFYQFPFQLKFSLDIRKHEGGKRFTKFIKQ